MVIKGYTRHPGVMKPLCGLPVVVGNETQPYYTIARITGTTGRLDPWQLSGCNTLYNSDARCYLGGEGLGKGHTGFLSVLSFFFSS